MIKAGVKKWLSARKAGTMELEALFNLSKSRKYVGGGVKSAVTQA